METMYAAVTGICFGLICLRTGRWPLELAHHWIIAVRAFALWLQLYPWQAVCREWRKFEECQEQVRREG